MYVATIFLSGTYRLTTDQKKNYLHKKNIYFCGVSVYSTLHFWKSGRWWSDGRLCLMQQIWSLNDDISTTIFNLANKKAVITLDSHNDKAAKTQTNTTSSDVANCTFRYRLYYLKYCVELLETLTFSKCITWWSNQCIDSFYCKCRQACRRNLNVMLQ